MAKRVAFLFVAMVFMAMMTTSWGREFRLAEKPKHTKIHVFLNNIQTLNPLPSETVAQASTTASSPTGFGRVLGVDAPMTEVSMSEDINAKVVGRIQGLAISAGHAEFAGVDLLTFVFNENGPYKGSTLTAVGRVMPALTEWTEINHLIIVGGTGLFQRAQGRINSRTVFVDPKRGDVSELKLDFIHYPPTAKTH
ncbi:OLC1v1013798C1 [Oldenlandia corymbosa var. corymbosa]|uniref:Dirigent protein n=1 Tax=Oldenlandia corymbosa var. corymbosa TaxID=529605 RepID=A0AAV1DZ92_OLDCO|nr:OLC1v1013798C1 [Oldenlandia corymbosa var. corymbosa]